MLPSSSRDMIFAWLQVVIRAGNAILLKWPMEVEKKWQISGMDIHQYHDWIFQISPPCRTVCPWFGFQSMAAKSKGWPSPRKYWGDSIWIITVDGICEGDGHLNITAPMLVSFRGLWSPLLFKFPLFSTLGLRRRQKSVQPLYNVHHLFTCDNKNQFQKLPMNPLPVCQWRLNCTNTVLWMIKHSVNI